MPNKTRKFTYPLLKWAYKHRNISAEAAHNIADRICYLLREEDANITKITIYLIYQKSPPTPKIYFVIHSPADPPDTHMVFPLLDNPLMEGTFLDEDEQHDQGFLNQFYSYYY